MRVESLDVLKEWDNIDTFLEIICLILQLNQDFIKHDKT